MKETVFYEKSFDYDVDQDAVKPEYRAFAKSLHNTMQERRMSVKELSEKTGIAQNVLSGYRNGKKFPGRPDSLYKIAAALGVTIDYLLGYSTVKLPDVSVQAMESYTGLSGNSLFLLNRIPSISETINSLCRDDSSAPFISFCQAVSELNDAVSAAEQKIKAGDSCNLQLQNDLTASIYKVERFYQKLPSFSVASDLLDRLEKLDVDEIFNGFRQYMEAHNGEHQED